MAKTKKRKKKNRKPQLKRKLWIIFSKYIRARDNYICFTCGKQLTPKNSDAGHYVPRSAGLSLYFDERNVHCQCTYCNRFMHGNLSQYALKLVKKYGEGILEDLDKKRRKITRYSEDEYLEMIVYYKNKLENDYDIKI